MEKSEQRFVVKFFFLKCLGSKEIHSKLTAALGIAACFLIEITEWRVRFETGDLSCEDWRRPDRCPDVLGKALADFLEESPFATARAIAQLFNQSKHIINETLQRELESWKFSRRPVPHSLSDTRRTDQRAMGIDLSNVLCRQASYSFSRIAIGDECEFLSLHLSDHMFAASQMR
jgi:hypothetical protein